jgi:hypothetical protein
MIDCVHNCLIDFATSLPDCFCYCMYSSKNCIVTCYGGEDLAICCHSCAASREWEKDIDTCVYYDEHFNKPGWNSINKENCRSKILPYSLAFQSSKNIDFLQDRWTFFYIICLLCQFLSFCFQEIILYIFQLCHCGLSLFFYLLAYSKQFWSILIICVVHLHPSPLSDQGCQNKIRTSIHNPNNCHSYNYDYMIYIWLQICRVYLIRIFIVTVT